MLILAGVSISAIVGDDGILAKTQYASFLNEMAAIEEAVQLWKVNQDEMETAIPTSGMCQPETLEKGERLKGEIGFYRSWNTTKTVSNPAIINEKDNDVFNVAFAGEIVYYPGGVQDLYYLNNDALGLTNKKKYIIDAANGMIYSTSGVTLNGIRCYSLNMAKALNSGNLEMPVFASAEVSGGGASGGETLAGNFSTEYQDADGKEVYLGSDGKYYYADGTEVDTSSTTVNKNENYNPNGFRIISSQDSYNVYKLYNNGDLYAKGIKGTQINTDKSEMLEIDSNVWSQFSIPSEIQNCEKVIRGYETVYFITSSGDLYALGKNDSNKLGLTQEEQISFTGREPVKLNVAGQKISNVFDIRGALFAVTTSGDLYACGYNTNYSLGLGHNNTIYTFEKVNITLTSNIKDIFGVRTNDITIIRTVNNEFYAAGSGALRCACVNKNGLLKEFTRIYDGYDFEKKEGTTEGEFIKSTEKTEDDTDFDSDITDIAIGDGVILMKMNNITYATGRIFEKYVGEEPEEDDEPREKEATSSIYDLTNLNEFLGINIKDFGTVNYSIYLVTTDNELYVYEYNYNIYGTSNVSGSDNTFEKVATMPDINIKETFGYHSGDGKQVLYILDTSGFLYGISYDGLMLGTEGDVQKVVRTSCPKLESLKKLGGIYEECTGAECSKIPLFLGKDGALYSINESDILFRDKILQANWTKIATNVRNVSPGLNSGYGAKDTNSLAVVKRDNTVWVCGEDSGVIGLGEDEIKKIDNLTQINNSVISNNVIDAQLSDYQLYVLTSDNILYSTGYYSSGTGQSWPEGRAPGWEEAENHLNFEPILENVKMFHIGFDNRIAVCDDGIYAWGINFGKSYGTDLKIVPEKVNSLKDIDPDDVEKVFAAFYCGMVILKNGDIYTTANPTKSVTGNNTLSLGTSSWNRRDISDDENIIDGVASSSGMALLVTEDSKLYGWGRKRYLGKNVTDSADSFFVETELDLKNVLSITTGKNFLIVVTNDGKVYGTGDNKYGILGRWIGIDRNSPNSRYKTAFEWVECPELEI